jgi:CheY-like chemotaxis protein
MSKKIFILDDEPMFLDWIEDFVEAAGYDVEFITSINIAHEKLQASKLNEYAALIIDLNVPAAAELENIIKQKPVVFQNFRGLFIAQQARTKGISGNRIIVYSVHDIPEVEAMCERLDITYIPKNKARALKEKLRSIFKKA